MTRPPDLVNEAGTVRAWRFTAEPGSGPKDWEAGLASWLIDADEDALDQHGFRSWFVGGVSLRDVEGVPPAKRHYPEAQYELMCFTIDPSSGVTAEFYERRTAGDFSDERGFLVQPADIVFQWHGTTDEGAEGVLEAFVRAVVIGGLSPSRPPFELDPFGASAFSEDWRRRLRATVEHYATGHWPGMPGGQPS